MGNDKKDKGGERQISVKIPCQGNNCGVRKKMEFSGVREVINLEKKDLYCLDCISKGAGGAQQTVQHGPPTTTNHDTPNANKTGSGDVSDRPTAKRLPQLSELIRNAWPKSWYTSAAVLACLLGVLVCAFYFTPKFIDTKPPTETLTAMLVKEMKAMRSAFPNQSIDTWLNFKAAINSILEDDPSQPAVLLLVGSNSAESIKTVRCVAYRLAEITNKLLGKSPNEVVIPIEDVLQLHDKEDAMKEELERRIRSVLDNSFSVVLGHLDRIPPVAAMVLHGYCDNFGAPYKKSVIILTATFHPDKLPVDSGQVDLQLRNLWDKRLGPDSSASLVSRVANYPVFIQPDSTASCTP